jgi:hypothetical protein
VVDGDVSASLDDGTLKLPGEVPETEVFEYVHDNVDQLSSLIQQRCQCPNLKQDVIVKHVKKARIDAADPHLLFRRLGEELGFLSELVVRRGFISIYNERNTKAITSLTTALREFIQG